jgi:hypothetical protein
MNALIDTNVILDALMSRAPFHESSEQIFMLAAQDKLEANITASSVTDIYYLLHKHLHEAEPCKQMLQKLFTLFPGTGCERRRTAKERSALRWRIMRMRCLRLVQSGNKIERIITRNTKDFTASPVKAVSPEEFLQTSERLPSDHRAAFLRQRTPSRAVISEWQRGAQAHEIVFIMRPALGERQMWCTSSAGVILSMVWHCSHRGWAAM